MDLQGTKDSTGVFLLMDNCVFAVQLYACTQSFYILKLVLYSYPCLLVMY